MGKGLENVFLQRRYTDGQGARENCSTSWVRREAQIKPTRRRQHLLGRLRSKRGMIAGVKEDEEKSGPSRPAGRLYNGVAAVENGSVSQKVKQSYNTTQKLRSCMYTQEKWDVCPIKTCTQTFTAPLLITADKYKQPNVHQQTNGQTERSLSDQRESDHAWQCRPGKPPGMRASHLHRPLWQPLATPRHGGTWRASSANEK